MADIVQERRTEQEVVGDQVVERTTTTATSNGDTYALNKIIQVVYYIEGIILALLGLRFVLRLLGASTASSFVSFIYSLTYPFVAPFLGMFGTVWSYGRSRLEFETLIAMAVYALIVWIIAGLVRLGK